MPSGNQEPRRDPELKRKAWLAVFLGSALFWVVVALLIWKVWFVGRGTAPEWQMKREMLSQCYTTKWRDIPLARLG